MFNEYSSVNRLNSDQKSLAENRANHLFQQAFNKNWLGSLWSTLRGHSRQLLTLPAVQRGRTVQGHKSVGLRRVSLDRIKGSNCSAKCHEFDADFRPLSERNRSRWMGVATVVQLGRKLPPVDLVQVDDVYFVTDGHHRVSVAKMLELGHIEANVTVLSLSAPVLQ
jgi:hypothetical protein